MLTRGQLEYSLMNLNIMAQRVKPVGDKCKSYDVMFRVGYVQHSESTCICNTLAQENEKWGLVGSDTGNVSENTVVWPRERTKRSDLGSNSVISLPLWSCLVLTFVYLILQRNLVWMTMIWNLTLWQNL